MNDLSHETGAASPIVVLAELPHLDLIQATREATHDPVDIKRLAALHGQLLSRHVTLNTDVSFRTASQAETRLWQDGLDVLLAADALLPHVVLPR